VKKETTEKNGKNKNKYEVDDDKEIVKEEGQKE